MNNPLLRRYWDNIQTPSMYIVEDASSAYIPQSGIDKVVPAGQTQTGLDIDSVNVFQRSTHKTIGLIDNILYCNEYNQPGFIALMRRSKSR